MLLTVSSTRRRNNTVKLIYILMVAFCTIFVYSSVVRAYYIYNIASIGQQIKDAALNSPDILNPPIPNLHDFCEDFAKFRSKFPATFTLGNPMDDLYSVASTCSKTSDTIPYTVTYKD